MVIHPLHNEEQATYDPLALSGWEKKNNWASFINYPWSKMLFLKQNSLWHKISFPCMLGYTVSERKLNFRTFIEEST